MPKKHVRIRSFYHTLHLIHKPLHQREPFWWRYLVFVPTAELRRATFVTTLPPPPSVRPPPPAKTKEAKVREEKLERYSVLFCFFAVDAIKVKIQPVTWALLSLFQRSNPCLDRHKDQRWDCLLQKRDLFVIFVIFLSYLSTFINMHLTLV